MLLMVTCVLWSADGENQRLRLPAAHVSCRAFRRYNCQSVMSVRSVVSRTCATYAACLEGVTHSEGGSLIHTSQYQGHAQLVIHRLVLSRWVD
jgi:hypothetical protein